MNSDNRLAELYYTRFQSPPSIQKFVEVCGNAYPEFGKDEIIKFLRNQYLYQIYYIPPKHRNFRPITSKARNAFWNMDLVILGTPQSRFYLLTIVDVYSRYAWVYYMKTKTPTNTLSKCLRILKKYKPKLIQIDGGSEFKGAFSDYCVDNDIEIKTVRPHNHYAQGIVESFNKTIMNKLKKRQKAKGGRIVDLIKSVLSEYRNSIHSGIKTTPHLVFKAGVMPQYRKRKSVRDKGWMGEKIVQRLFKDEDEDDDERDQPIEQGEPDQLSERDEHFTY